MGSIVVLYCSEGGSTQAMARAVSMGVESVDGMQACLRQVAPVVASNQMIEPEAVPEHGAPYASLDDLRRCDGLAIGSPTHFGNMAASLKYFLDQTTALWFEGSLIGKPAGCFTSVGSMHGGHESTLLSMMLPLLHHGMLLVGLPYSQTQLLTTQAGGTPYGPSHWAGAGNDQPHTADETQLCRALGQRLALLAAKQR